MKFLRLQDKQVDVDWPNGRSLKMQKMAKISDQFWNSSWNITVIKIGFVKEMVWLNKFRKILKYATNISLVRPMMHSARHSVHPKLGLLAESVLGQYIRMAECLEIALVS